MKRFTSNFRTILSVLLATALVVSSCAAAGLPQGPDGAVHNVVIGLAANHPEVMWQALPASYQSDINGLVRDFADQMDPEVWNRSFGVFSKAAQVLSEKKEFILANPMVAQQLVQKPEIEQNWDGIVDLLNIIAASQIATLDQLRDLNIEAFLADTVGELMAQAEVLAALSSENPLEKLDKLQKLTVDLISNDGSEAVLEIGDEGEEPRRVEFMQVEGKWIPREMAQEWPMAVEHARSQLVEVSNEELLQNKEAILGSLTMTEGALDGMLAAQDINQFNMALQSLIGAVMMQALTYGKDAQGK
ncbi:MAG: hypothetical protein V3T83_07480 [Acidobacteriota bacterium]